MSILATENGLQALLATIAAQDEWRALTPTQRRCLLSPLRPAHMRTVSSLIEKGLLMSGTNSFPLSEYGEFVVKMRPDARKENQS